jgi:hypothetical protein
MRAGEAAMLRKEQNDLVTRAGPNTDLPFKDAAKEALKVRAGFAPATV